MVECSPAPIPVESPSSPIKPLTAESGMNGRSGPRVASPSTEKAAGGELSQLKRVLRANPNQVSGQKLLFLDEEGNVCKQAHTNELKWYNKCEADAQYRPFLAVIP